MTEPSALDYYRSWIAYEALQEAVQETTWRTVWNRLSCTCCPEPLCWQSLPIEPLSPVLDARIRWYDHVSVPESSSHTDDLDASEVRQLQAHFVGHHQRIELVLLCLKPSLDKIYDLLAPYKENMEMIPSDVVEAVVKECEYAANGWYSVGQLIRGVAKMDRIKYLQYVPRLAGVSGGNSPLMMPQTSRTAQLESVFASFSDAQLANAIRERTVAGQIAEAFIDCLDSLSRCWFGHVVTATTAIGITSGTKGTPNIMLVERVNRRLHGSRLLKALGCLRKPLSGIGGEMHQLFDYQAYPLAEHYLDLFDDPGPEFGTHNVGWLPREFDRARADYLELRRTLRTGIWQHFYQETRPAFCHALSGLLGVENATGYGLGSSVTEVLSRLTASLRVAGASDLTVILPDDEFVTLQRAAVSLGRSGASVERVPWDEMESKVKLVKSLEQQEEKKEHEGVKVVVLLSLVNSCTQRIQELGWIRSVPTSGMVIVDITQAIGNIPLDGLGFDALVRKGNVFFVGSLIKHARCGENLGFLAYCRGLNCIIQEPESGWTAYPSGLRENKTAKFEETRLLYEDPLEFDGGTPSCIESAFVATRIIKSLPTVKEQHEYVQSIKRIFLEKVGPLLSDLQKSAVSDSNTLALPVSKVLSDPLPFGLDYKIVNDETVYLRIGFGIHNLAYHVKALVEVLQKTGALSG